MAPNKGIEKNWGHEDPLGKRAKDCYILNNKIQMLKSFADRENQLYIFDIVIITSHTSNFSFIILISSFKQNVGIA